MKCPYCGIHYMDDERECPICGKRSPIFGQKTAHKHRAFPDTPSTTCAHDRRRSRDSLDPDIRDTAQYPSIRRKPAKKPRRSRPAQSSSRPAQTTARAHRKGDPKRNKSLKVVILLVILINVLPALFGVAVDLWDEFEYAVSEKFDISFAEAAPEPATPAPETAIPASEMPSFEVTDFGLPMPDEDERAAIEEAFAPCFDRAAYFSEESGLLLVLDGENAQYQLNNDAQSVGEFYWWYEYAPDWYPEGTAPETHCCFVLALCPDDADEDTYLLAYVPMRASGTDAPILLAPETDAPILLAPEFETPTWFPGDAPLFLRPLAFPEIADEVFFET